MTETKKSLFASDEETARKKSQLRTKKIGSRTLGRKKSAESVAAEQRIDVGLASIYQNENGGLPDMKKIDIKKRHPFLGFIITVLSIGSLLAFAAWIGFFVLPSSGNFSENQVTLAVEGPAKVLLGATTTYKISYANNQTTAIDNATLSIWYPAGFIFVTSSIPMNNGAHNEASLGSVPNNTEKTITITGLTYGALNQAGSLRLSLKYLPKNTASSFLQKTADFVTTVTQSPYTIGIEAPASLGAGNQTQITFIVKNASTGPLPELHLTPMLPTNFILSSSTPALGKDTQWVLKATTSTPANDKGYTFVLHGSFSDEGDSKLPIKAALFIVTPTTKELYKIAESGVESNLLKTGAVVTVALNGSLDNQNVLPGNTLNYTVNIKNTSATDIKDISLLLAIDAPSYKNQSILKWSDIVDKFDGDIKGEQISDALRHGQISWNKKKIPALAALKAGQELNVDVQLPIKTNQDIDLKNFSESKITTVATMAYTDTAGASKNTSASPLLLLINSDLSFKAVDTAEAAGTGEKHAVQWVLNNTLHPLRNITLSATVFGDRQSTSRQALLPLK
jgi:hypothetical protein